MVCRYGGRREGLSETVGGWRSREEEVSRDVVRVVKEEWTHDDSRIQLSGDQTHFNSCQVDPRVEELREKGFLVEMTVIRWVKVSVSNPKP